MPRPLRVAFVSHYPHLRMGGQRATALLIEHFDRRLVQPIGICPGPGELTDYLRAIDCPVTHVPLHPIKPRTLLAVWRSVRQIRALLHQEAIDVIAPDSPRDVLVTGLAKLGTPTTLVWFVRLTRRDRLDPILERLADGFIADSDATRNRFSASPRVTRLYRTIHGGADLRWFRPVADRAALRQELGLPPAAPVLLFVGQVTHGKGILDVVSGLGRLATLGVAAPVLVVAGTPSPPSITAEIEATARAGGVWDRVRMVGQQEGVQRWMQAADLLVSASHEDTEGMSRVLYEAMACGLVPVATDIRGNREAVTPDVGVLVPEQAPAELARAVATLLAQPDRRAALAAQGVRRAREEFDITRHARAVEQFLLEHRRPEIAAATARGP